MNINILTGLLDGGAANAALQLYHGLRQRDIRSRLYYAPRLGNRDQADGITRPQWHSAGFVKQLKFRLHRTRFKRIVRGRPPGNEIFTSPIGAPLTRWPPANHTSTPEDVLHLHWVAKFIDTTSFFQSLTAQQVVVWTLHDMNAFTGGCHFTGGCQQFVQGCGHCPQLPQPAANDLSSVGFAIKQNALRNINLHVVTASCWMSDQAKQSPIFAHAKSFRRIPYGLPLDQYTPVDRLKARQQLGLDPDAFVFAFGAADIENKRKGAKLLLDGLQQVADLPNVQGLVLGGGELPKTSTPLPPLRSLGFIKEVDRRVMVYSACDAFVLPSTQDNLPLTGLEVLASGTPIVGFNCSGVPDIVRPGETGLLAEPDNAMDLGNQLRYLAEHSDEARRMGTIARQVALAEYGDKREADDYIKLYAALLADKV